MTYLYISAKFQWRKDTAANWAANNPTPLAGEPCLETDTTWPIGGGWKFKIGDGVTAWNSLDYAVGDVPFTDDAPSDGTGYVRKDGAWASESGGSGGGTDLRTVAQFYDECEKPNITYAGWASDTASGTIIVQQSVSGMPGCYALASSSVSGGRAAATADGFKVIPGTGEIRCFFRVKPEHLPSASQQTDYRLGLFDGSVTGATNSIHLWARDSNATGDWYLRYTHTSGTVASTTAITLTAGAIVDIELVFAADGSSVSAYTDGVLRDTLALPASFPAMHPGIMSRKNGATGVSSKLWVDKVLIEKDL